MIDRDGIQIPTLPRILDDEIAKRCALPTGYHESDMSTVVALILDAFHLLIIHKHSDSVSDILHRDLQPLWRSWRQFETVYARGCAQGKMAGEQTEGWWPMGVDGYYGRAWI